ncbi:MAG: hypothetical protein U1F07_00930 [Rubrivivax sp.]
MSRLQHAIVTTLAALGLLLVGTDLALAALNRGLQEDVALRQQYVQQSVQLEGLYREIVRALAELGARHNDEAVRSLLQRHGITYTVSAPPAPAAAAAGPRK